MSLAKDKSLISLQNIVCSIDQFEKINVKLDYVNININKFYSLYKKSFNMIFF